MEKSIALCSRNNPSPVTRHQKIQGPGRGSTNQSRRDFMLASKIANSRTSSSRIGRIKSETMSRKSTEKSTRKQGAEQPTGGNDARDKFQADRFGDRF